MREKVTSLKEQDLLVPIDKVKIMAEVKDSDCFGKEWDPEQRECAICCASVPCGIIFQDNLKVKSNKKSSNQFDKLVAVLQNWHRSSTLASVEDMFDYFGNVLKTNDEEVIVPEMKKFIKGNDDIYTKEGYFYSKLVDNETS